MLECTFKVKNLQLSEETSGNATRKKVAYLLFGLVSLLTFKDENGMMLAFILHNQWGICVDTTYVAETSFTVLEMKGKLTA